MTGADCRVAFADTLIALAEADRRIVAVVNDSVGSSNLKEFKRRFPDRLFNVGIAEQNLVGVSAGLASAGKIPFTCGASCFLTGRALEQVKADLAYSRHNVKLCGMSSGMAYGELGPTHHSIEDLAWTRAIAGLTVIVPADPIETAGAVRAAVAIDGPVFLRLSRMPVPTVTADAPPFEIGKAVTLRQGRDVTIIAAGVTVGRALEAATLLASDGVDAAVMNLSTVRPIDRDAIAQAASRGPIVTVEEHTVHGGLGSAVAEVVVTTHPVRMRLIGVPGVFAPTGSPEFLLDHFGITAEGIRAAARELVQYRNLAMRHVLAIDQGTTNTKAFLFDERSAIAAAANHPVPIEFPRAGWVEQDANAIWRSVEEAIHACLSSAQGARVDAVAVTNQRESVLLWDKTTGSPIGPVIVWQCRRTSDFCETLRSRGLQEHLETVTGLTIDPLFSASKLRWLLTTLAGAMARAERGELCAGTIDSWLIWKLTAGRVHACDATNASRTQLLDLRSGGWDPDLLSLFSIPAGILPTVRASSGIFGEVTTIPGLQGVPIASAIGDSHAALFGHAAFAPGQVKATYGTGSSLMTIVPAPVHSRHGLSTTIAWSVNDEPQYALEGNITVTGSAVEWIGQITGLSSSSDAGDLARSVADTGGVYFVPALAGLGAPHWDAAARGLLCGLSRGTTAAHLARASIESIAYQVRDVFDAMCEDAGPSSALLADGGASQNDALMQFQSDVLGVPVIRTASANVSALGAAWLAGLAVGVWRDANELAQLPRSISRFEPAMSLERREHLYAGWRDAVSRTLSRRPRAGSQY